MDSEQVKEFFAAGLEAVTQKEAAQREASLIIATAKEQASTLLQDARGDLALLRRGGLTRAV